MNLTRHVLVVEDDRLVRKLLYRQLSSLGCRVDLANDGCEGWSLWERNDYDLVITDFSMPGMNGLELTSRIRASGRRTARSVPVIAVTGHTGDERSRCAAGGITDVIGKPFSLTDLQSILERWVPGTRGGELRDTGQDEAGGIASPIAAPGPSDDSAIMRSIMLTFIETIPEYMQALDKACAARDRATLFEAAHRLKSAARLVGGDTVADLCEAIEDASEDTDISALLQSVAPVPDAVKELEESLKQRLASPD